MREKNNPQTNTEPDEVDQHDEDGDLIEVGKVSENTNGGPIGHLVDPGGNSYYS